MRKRSRRRSRRRSSRRGRRNQSSLTRHIGTALVVALLSAGVWIWFSGDEESVSVEASRLGIPEVEAKNSESAKADRRSNERAMLREASTLFSAAEQSDVNARRVAQAEAYSRIAEILEGEISVDTRAKLVKPFNALTDRLFFGPERNEHSEVYIVKSGDNIGDIAKSYGVTQELLCQWNEIAWENRARINIGQSLKVINAPISVRVDKSEFTLSYYFGDKLARQFIIAHGRNNGTPLGEASVISKRVDPDVGENLPANLLEMDERWIGLSLLEGRSGIGIHGTKHQDQIPGESSAGCVRMFNDDVVRLYSWLPMGASVKIEA